jgi:adenosine deaminase
MDLADLHRHLDGSLRSDTLHELARAAGVAVPEDMGFTPGMGLEQALQRFAVTVAALQRPEALSRVASEICEDAARDGVTTLEVRFAPQLHGAIAPAVDAVLDGVRGRAGIILCALFGDPVELVDALVDAAASRPGVVGLDLAGAPSSGHRWEMRDYARPFRRAADLGVGRTVHAGEGRPAAEIRVAIEELLAERVGHGTTLLDDPDLVELALARGITIEACLTSNLQTGAIAALADHPLPRWLARGVHACICTDNTLLSDTSSAREHELARALPGMTDALLARAIEHGHRAAFRRR